MTATNNSRTDAAPAATTTPLKALNEYELNTLAHTEGPCITIQVPGFRPGAPDDVRSTLLRQLTHIAAAQLRDFDRSERGSKLLASLEGLSGDPDVLAGGPGLTLCIAPGLASVFVTPEVREHVTVGSRFHLLPLLAMGALPPEVYALGVNQNHIRLWRVRPGSAEEVAWPPGVPVSLADAGAFDQPDHDLENRSSAGPSVGGMRVRFGTSAERGDAYLHKFFKLVADGLQETIRNAPVMLIGVREDLAEYRRASNRGNLLASEWHAAPAHCSASDVAIHAHEAVVGRFRDEGEALLKALPEASARILGDVEAITSAARDGRVHQLLAAEDAVPAAPVNAAVVEALRTGAEVLTLPGESLPTGGPLGAILRY